MRSQDVCPLCSIHFLPPTATRPPEPDLATWKVRAEEQDKIIKAHINVNAELFNELIETEAERDKYKEDYEVSSLTILFQSYTISNWKKASNLWEKVAKGWKEEARKLSEAIDKHISQH